MLTYTAKPDEPAPWKILLPTGGGTEDLYGTHRFLARDAARLGAWLSPIGCSDNDAVLAPAGGWRQHDSHDD